MTKIFFTKMQGLGKDFVILDWEEYRELGLKPADLAKSMCKRKFGIGADGLIIVDPVSEKADLAMICFSAQGQSAQVCGDDLRCFARYAWHKGYVDKLEFSIETLNGVFGVKVNDDSTVTVNTGKLIGSHQFSFNEVSNLIYITGPADFLFEGVYYYNN